MFFSLPLPPEQKLEELPETQTTVLESCSEHWKEPTGSVKAANLFSWAAVGVSSYVVLQGLGLFTLKMCNIAMG